MNLREQLERQSGRLLIIFWSNVMSKNKKSKKKRCEYCDKPTTVKYDDEYCCHSCHNEIERQNTYQILESIGVPFGMDGDPVGIWSDD